MCTPQGSWEVQADKGVKHWNSKYVTLLTFVFLFIFPNFPLVLAFIFYCNQIKVQLQRSRGYKCRDPMGRQIIWVPLCFLPCKASRPRGAHFRDRLPLRFLPLHWVTSHLHIKSTMNKDFLCINAWLFISIWYLSPLPLPFDPIA